MSNSSGGEISQLLAAWGGGDRSALDALVPMVHAELRRLAARYMAGERAGHSLQATELVNEAYMRLVHNHVQLQNRTHFFAISARLMRQILVDHARGAARKKRGGGACKVTLDEALAVSPEPSEELLALDAALEKLAGIDERKARVVELRYFGGLSVEQAAEALGVSANTVIRDWSMARAWLLRDLAEFGQTL